MGAAIDLPDAHAQAPQSRCAKTKVAFRPAKDDNSGNLFSRSPKSLEAPAGLSTQSCRPLMRGLTYLTAALAVDGTLRRSTPVSVGGALLSEELFLRALFLCHRSPCQPSAGNDHRWRRPGRWGSPDVKRAMNSEEGEFRSTFDFARDTADIWSFFTRETEGLN